MALRQPQPDDYGAITLGPTEVLFDVKHASIGNRVIDWGLEYIIQPDGPKAGQTFHLTEEQITFLLNWYGIDDDGQFVYRSGVYRRMKGGGKNPFGAFIEIAEFVGPTVFSKWSENGRFAVCKPHHSAWVQNAATSKDQTRNMMTLFPAMISKKLELKHAIDIGKEIIYAENGRCRIESITSSPRAIEGGRPTFIGKDETHHWLEANQGHAMARVIARNAAKSREGGARSIAFTNAHDPSEDSSAQQDLEAFIAMDSGKSRSKGFLYSSREAPPDTDLKDRRSLTRGLLAARGDSTWIDVDRLINEIWDPRTTPQEARRFYLNQIIAAEDAWISPHEWDLVARPGYVVQPKAEICLGFDGSKSGDHTALVGCEVETSHLFTLGAWDPTEFEDGEIPRVAIDGAVTRAFDTYLVNGFYSDLEEWESYVDVWEQRFGSLLYAKASPLHPIQWDMRGHRKEATLATEALHDAIIEKQVTHEGDKKISLYVYNARRRPNQYGIAIGKESKASSRKIDWTVAAIIARKCRQDYLALPKDKQRRRKTRKAVFV